MDADEEELAGYIREQVFHFINPKGVFILDSFPTNGTGMVFQREIQKTVRMKL